MRSPISSLLAFLLALCLDSSAEGTPLESGTKEQIAEAIGKTRKAAEQGLAEAQFNLAVRYNMGEGVPQD